MIRSFAGLRGIIGTAAALVRNQRPFSELGEELQAIARVDASALNALARKAVPLEQGLLVLVGDAALVREQLKGLGLPEAILLDVSGDPVERSDASRGGVGTPGN